MVGIDLYPCPDVAPLKTGDGGAADISGDCHLLGPLQGRTGQQGLAKSEHRVEIDLRRIERGIEFRRLSVRGKDVSQAAGDRLAGETGGEMLDRQAFAAERHVAAQA